MGVVKFHLAAKIEGADAYGFMDFCCDGNVTLECNCELLRVPWRNRGVRSAYIYMDFCCDGNVTQDVTATYGIT